MKGATHSPLHFPSTPPSSDIGDFDVGAFGSDFFSIALSSSSGDVPTQLGQRTVTLDSGVGTLLGVGRSDTKGLSRGSYLTCRSSFDSSCLATGDDQQHQNQNEVQSPQQEADRKALADAKDLLARAVNRNAGHINDYQLTSLLGFGTFGIVLKALTRDKANAQNQQVVALKMMRKVQIHSSRMCLDPHTRQQVPLEVALLKFAPASRHIIRYVDSWEDDECWYLVTEFGGHAWNTEPIDSMSGLPKAVAGAASYVPLSPVSPAKFMTPSEMAPTDGEVVELQSGPVCHSVFFPTNSNDHSLAGLLRACGGYTSDCDSIIRTGRPVLPDNIQKRVFRQVVQAVRDLHHSGITHKDLKDENILVDGSFNVKLIDFGHAAFYQSPRFNPSIRRFTQYGTPLFAAPEIRSERKFIGPEADVYALGLILYELNSGDLPDNLEQARYVPNGQTCFDISFRTGFFTEEVRHLCQWMLCPDPANRPTIDDVLRHSWFC